jgi:predicted MPP superfamily phosphohydrolase
MTDDRYDDFEAEGEGHPRSSTLLTRRQLLCAAAAVLGTSAAAALYASEVEPHWVEFVERPLPIRGLAPGMAGARLVQLSDVHAGFVEEGYVLDTFRRVADYRPDIVVLTGDFISWKRGILEQAAHIYRSLPHGRLATLGILGNHDYGNNWNRPEVAEALVALLEPLGVRMLRNAVADVGGLRIAGLEDFWGPYFEAGPVLARIGEGDSALVLSHNPDSLDQPGWDAYRGWVLSGHTHGGQCRPPFLPPPVLPVQNKRYTAGEIGVENRRLYINRGLGHFWKVRFNVRPEVTVFTLEPAA